MAMGRASIIAGAAALARTLVRCLAGLGAALLVAAPAAAHLLPAQKATLNIVGRDA